ncbi:MAG: 3-keto-disaccharide hydrolase [Bacteroidota bacterium]
MKKTLILLVSAIMLIVTGCTGQSDKIFNGKNLSNWNFVIETDSIPPEEVFSVKDYSIFITGKPIGYMYTKRKYSDFSLETEWRWLGEAGNSGIFLLIESPDNPFPRAIECQLKAGNAGDFVLLNHSQLAEYALPEGVTERPKFPVIPKKNNSNENPVGEWNNAKIVIKEGHISVYINDLLQNEGTSPVTEGHIGLQSEGYGVQFRNISISE